MGFHESLSHELKAAEKDGIKTTLVCPYLVDTGMFRGCRIRSVSCLDFFSFLSFYPGRDLYNHIYIKYANIIIVLKKSVKLLPVIGKHKYCETGLKMCCICWNKRTLRLGLFRDSLYLDKLCNFPLTFTTSNPVGFNT